MHPKIWHPNGDNGWNADALAEHSQKYLVEILQGLGVLMNLLGQGP